jgi:uncharacterized protein with NRDE domain
MCIVVFRWQADSNEPLVVAANRDEFFARPTAPLHWWPGSDILAGRDERSGGTWMGVTRHGRFALLTNVRDPRLRKTNAPSRGKIVSDFLSSDRPAHEFLTQLSQRSQTYEGFNVVCGDLASARRALWFLNSQENVPREIGEGVFALSNASLDTPWPKVERVKAAFREALARAPYEQPDAIDALLQDDARAVDASLPRTGVPLEWERALSSVFIRHGNYGTRASTQLFVRDDRVDVTERTHLPEHANAQQLSFSIPLNIAK